MAIRAEPSATPSPVLEDPLQLASKKEKYLACTICLDNFKEPKVLPCCHTFCKSCLERIIEKAEVKEKILCPQCRAEHKVPSNGPEGFLTDFSLLHDLEEIKLPKSETKESYTCGECDSSDTAIAFCTECQSYLCNSCATIHKKLKHFRNHKVTSLECLDSEAAKAKTSTLQCHKHPEEPLKVFCKTCEVLVCCHCIVDSHQQHKLGQINEDTRLEVQAKLQTLSKQAHQKLAEFEENLKYIKEVEEVVAGRPTCVQTAINGTFDSLVATLEARRLQLLKEAEDKSNKDLKEIWSQEEFVEATVVSLSTTLAFAQRTLQCNHDIELLSLSPQAIHRLKKLKDRKWNPAMVQSIDVSKLNFVRGNHTAYLKRIGELEEGMDITRMPVVIQNPPAHCQLGVCKDLLVVGKITSSTKHYNLKPEHIAITVVYGKSNKQKTINAQTCTQKQRNISCVVPFTPTCGGKHRVVVSLKGALAKLHAIEGKKTFEFTTTVTGRPTLGAKVCRGPDWIYDDHDTNIGIVKTSAEVNKVTVSWNNGNCYAYNWGDELGYEVELVQ